MNRFLIALSLFSALLHAQTQPAAPLSIQPAVQLTFETTADKYYQLEVASELSPTIWSRIGKSHHGRGQPINETVITSTSKQFFRSQEYDLTNGLFAHFPLNGNGTNIMSPPSTMVDLIFTTNRFGAANMAVQLSSLWYERFARSYVDTIAAGTNDLTISFWFAQPTTNAPTQLLSFWSSREIQITQAAPKSNALKLLNTNSVVSFVSKPVEWTTNRWYHLQLVCKDNVFKLYRDLDLLGEGPATPPVGLNPSSFISVGPGFGCADEIRLHNRALTDDERSILYRLEE